MKNQERLEQELEEELSKDVLDLRGKLDDIVKLESGQGKSGPEKKTRMMKFILPIAAIAASILLAIVFIPTLFMNNDQSLFASYYETYPMALNQRGGEESVLDEAISAYLSKDYEQAAPLFRELYENENDEIYLFYSASAEMEAGNLEEALQRYSDVIASGNEKVVEQAQWYKALALIQLERVSEAEQLLSALPESHYKFAAIKDLLKDLR